MKNKILIFPLIALSFGVAQAQPQENIQELDKDSTYRYDLLPWNSAFADEVNNIQNRTLACAGTYPIGNIYEERIETVKTLINGEPVTTYSPWNEITRDCRTNILETRNVACPANQRGTHSQRRTYVQYYDGRIINDTGWQTTSNNCDYYYVSTGSQTRNVGCPAGYTGAHHQSRTFQNWSNGTIRNDSGWITTSYTCQPPKYHYTVTTYGSDKARLTVSYKGHSLSHNYICHKSASVCVATYWTGVPPIYGWPLSKFMIRNTFPPATVVIACFNFGSNPGTSGWVEEVAC